MFCSLYVKEIYERILEKALPLYRRGRDGDVEHVKWLSEVIVKYADESELDYDILLPVVILHDVGYSKISKGANPYDLDIRKLHSELGAEISQEILEELDYPKDKIKEVKRLILKHDNWAFGDTFDDEPILRIFNNFDFMWKASKERFEILKKFKQMDTKDFYLQIQELQKGNELEGRRWFNEKVEDFYIQLMRDRKKEIF